MSTLPETLPGHSETGPEVPAPAAAAAPPRGFVAAEALVGDGGALRLRILMYAALVAIALGVACAGWANLRLDDERMADAVILELSAAQRTQAEQAARLGLLLAADPASRKEHVEALQALLVQMRTDAVQLGTQRLAHAAARPSVNPVAAQEEQAWEDAHARLAQRAESVLKATAGRPKADGLRAALALQAEVAPVDDAALRVSATLGSEGAARGAALHRNATIGLAVLLALLLGLAAVVVEPAVRSVRRQAQRLRSQSTELRRLALVAEHTTGGVLITDRDDRVQWANAAYTQLTGWSLQDALGRRPGELLAHPQADEDALRAMQDAVRSAQGLRQAWLHRGRNGGDLWLSVDLCPLRGDGGTLDGYIRVCTDVSPHPGPEHPAMHTLATGAPTEALTALPDRTVVMARLRHALEHLRRHPGYGFAVLCMNFDPFKPINDTLGQGAGDDILRQIACRLSLSVRPGDAWARLEVVESVAAHLGGDPFVVVLDGVSDEARVQAIAQRLLQELAEPYLLDGCTPVHSAARIGIVLCTGEILTDTGPTAEELLRHADTAMHEAQRSDRGRSVLFNNSMHERRLRALAVETDLRRALQDDELLVVYQPVVDLSSLAMVGVEALVRWRHPEQGLVSAAAFIGVAEQCGLIDAIGNLVLRTACAQFMRWQTELGLLAPRQLAVKLSRAQLEREDLVDEVRGVLQACAMPPEHLQLELTEILGAQGAPVQVQLRKLKSLGVRLALDDFGTGYASLACLHELPVDTVKVDRSFVQQAQTVEHHRVLIEATLSVARMLGMTTVAAGIETQGQVELMRELTCDRGQGELFSRPLEAADLERWARRQPAVTIAPRLAEPA